MKNAHGVRMLVVLFIGIGVPILVCLLALMYFFGSHSIKKTVFTVQVRPSPSAPLKLY